jgi:hypothetical protein
MGSPLGDISINKQGRYLSAVAVSSLKVSSTEHAPAVMIHAGQSQPSLLMGATRQF